MSHISKIELEIKDLAILMFACKRLGLQFARDQQTYKWYSGNGKCDHAIKLPGADYEIGVSHRNGAYSLECDFYDLNIERAIGKNGGLLKQAYAVEKAKAEARRKGYIATEQKTESAIKLRIRIV